jgi:hypothetical protein
MRTNSGLRFTAKSIAAIVAASLVLSLSACAPSTKNPKTAEFLQSRFTSAGIEGFTPGQIDPGFTLEALTQLWATGTTSSAPVKAAADSVWSQAEKLETSGTFTDTATGALKAGLVAKALVFGSLFGKTSDASFKTLVDKLSIAVDNTGEISGSNGNVFDYGWAVLGLKAAHSQLASLVAVKLASLIRQDGGFGSDLSSNTTSSSADSTGMALMALEATKDEGTNGQLLIRTSAIGKAIAWLKKNSVESDHFEAWGDFDVNGTAYAAMGLVSAGIDVTSYSVWLASKVASDGGLSTPWSKGKGDTFATVQGLLALDGRGYVELVK